MSPRRGSDKAEQAGGMSGEKHEWPSIWGMAAVEACPPAGPRTCLDNAFNNKLDSSFQSDNSPYPV